jgi:hypothetical protein
MPTDDAPQDRDRIPYRPLREPIPQRWHLPAGLSESELLRGYAMRSSDVVATAAAQQ